MDTSTESAEIAIIVEDNSLTRGALSRRIGEQYPGLQIEAFGGLEALRERNDLTKNVASQVRFAIVGEGGGSLDELKGEGSSIQIMIHLTREIGLGVESIIAYPVRGDSAFAVSARKQGGHVVLKEGDIYPVLAAIEEVLSD